MAAVQEWRIHSEADLWELLEELLKADPEAVEPKILWEGWQPELLYFPDAPVGHVVSPTLAKTITAYHASLSRAYAYLVYGTADSRRLHARDREWLDISILVVDGSNGLEVSSGAVDTLVKGVVAKTSGRQIIFGLVIFLLLYFGADVAKQWLSQRYEERRLDAQVEERILLSREETRRLEVFAEALGRRADLSPLAVEVVSAREGLVRGATIQNHSRVLGTDLRNSQARTILSGERQQGEGRRMDGLYEIIDLNTENPDGYLGRIRSLDTHEEYPVEIYYSDLTKEDLSMIFYSLEEKAPVSLSVNAWVVNEKVARAVIVRADPAGSKE